jgi:peptidyl-prolyl cis-trans isomerase SurA
MLTFRFLPTALAAFALAGLTAASAVAATPAEPLDTRRAALPAGYAEVDGIAAVAGNQIITMGDLRRAVGSHLQSQSLVPTDAERPRSEADLRMQTLQSLIDSALVLQAAKDLGLSVEDKEVDDQVNGTRKKQGWSEKDMQQAVRRLGFRDLPAYRGHVRNELLRMQMLRVKLGARLRVTDEEVKRVIDQENGGGKYEDEVRSRHILVLVPADASPSEVARLREKAWKIHDEVMEGKKTFAELAEEYSDDHGAEEGDLGYLRRWTLDPTFANKLWSMQKGEISKVVQTPFGFHIIQMLDRRRAEVKDREVLEQFVRARLSEEQFVRLYRAWIEELRAATHIETRI